MASRIYTDGLSTQDQLESNKLKQTNQVITMNLVKYDQNGLELWVDESTGLAYANLGAIRRMLPEVAKSTIQLRLKKCPSAEVKTAEILTNGGVWACRLYPASFVFDISVDFNPKIATQLIDVGFVSAEEWRDTIIIMANKRLKTPKKLKQQSVYILQCSQTGVVKIGISNNPVGRLSKLQPGYPFLLKLERVIKTDEPRLMERQLHRALDDFRLMGEWFDGACLQMIAS